MILLPVDGPEQEADWRDHYPSSGRSAYQKLLIARRRKTQARGCQTRVSIIQPSCLVRDHTSRGQGVLIGRRDPDW